MRKILLICFAVTMLALFSASASLAQPIDGPGAEIILSFDPVSQDVILGNPADVALVISGLGDGVAPSLSVFDLDVIYNPTILGFNSAVYGDPVLGDQLDLLLGSYTDTTPGAGSVNLLELSFDLPFVLDFSQAESFTLATLTFDTLALGTSSLDTSVNALGDSWGDPLAASTESGNINVNPIPEPATLILLGGGLAGLGLWRRRTR